MKKTLHRFTALALVLVLLAGLCLQAFAMWPGVATDDSDNYLSAGTLYSNGKPLTKDSLSVGGFAKVYLLEDGASAVMTPTSVNFGISVNTKDNTIDLPMGKSYDFSTPFHYNVTAADGRTAPVFVFATEATGGWSGWTDQDEKELLGMSELFANTFVQICRTINKIESAEEKIGSYLPGNAKMLYALGYWLGERTAFYSDPKSGQNGNSLFSSHEDTWQMGGEDAISFMQEYLQTYLNKKPTPSSGSPCYMKPSALRTIYTEIVPFYLNYALNTRIADPVITKVSIGDSVGEIDAARRTVTVNLPANTDYSKLGTPEVIAADGCKVRNTAGSIAQKTLAYQVTPYDEAYGTEYTSLSRAWKVQIQTGEPRNEVMAFGITVDGKTRYATIDQDNRTITLNLPVRTDLTKLKPIIEHTGTKTSMDGQTLNFSDGQSKKLTLTNSTFGLTTEYTVTVTNHESDENRILSYKIGDAVGTINGDTIAITVPYAEDLTKAEAVLEISEFATVTKPAALQYGANTYTVTSESNKTRNYTVTITRAAVATGNSILSFRYGSVEAVIDQSRGTILLELPAGSPSTFAPIIAVSPYATVSPASGEKKDFANPVKYTVKSQKGDTNTYTVTVKITAAAVENPYREKMEGLVQKITNRYAATTRNAWEDWEWMNLGLYQHKLANTSDGFSIAKCIAELDTTTTVAMTNLDRKIMTLTARGFDCTNLAQYNDGKPFLDAKGNEVDNLVQILYNYSGEYTINGPIFALNALDMGNYTIPENAVWTRDKLLETLLNHKYLSDGLGLDMVTMLMQPLGPYMNDPVYGERVTAKLEEGLQIVLKYFGSDNAFRNPYGVQWGGVYTSEGSAQIVCAMSSMGVDCHTHPEMSNESGQSALTALLDYADFKDGYFDHDNTALKNRMATYQGCYATQWYLGFLKNGGAGHPYSLYYQQFNFARTLSTDATITTFTMDGKQGVFGTDKEGRDTITVTLPAGTDLSKMIPHVTLSLGATLVQPDISKPIKFVADVATPFTVQAEDGKTQRTYYVTVKLDSSVKASGAELIPSSIQLTDGNILRALEILNMNVNVDDKGVTKIELKVNAGVDTTAIQLKADISYNATCNPAVDGKKALNLTNWTTFTVTSKDKTNTNVYQIKVTPKKQAEITSFKLTINGQTYTGTIDNRANTIKITGVDDSNLTSTSFAPDITLGEGTLICSPASGVMQDFSSAVQYIVNGDADTMISRTYTVTVLNKSGKLISKSSNGGSTEPVLTGAKITSFKIYDTAGEIDHNAGTIIIKLPNGTNVTKVAPQITTTSGCTVYPANNQVVNLTRPIEYTVTLGKETKVYTVKVVYERSLSQQLWDEVADNNTVNGGHQVSKDPHPLTGGRP